MAIENSNVIEAALTITAANPPVLVENNGFRASSLVRLGAGTYQITPDQLLSYDGSPALSGAQQIHCQSDGPNFCATQIQSDGSLIILAYSIAGAAADTLSRIDVMVFRMPTKD